MGVCGGLDIDTERVESCSLVLSDGREELSDDAGTLSADLSASEASSAGNSERAVMLGSWLVVPMGGFRYCCCCCKFDSVCAERAQYQTERTHNVTRLH